MCQTEFFMWDRVQKDLILAHPSAMGSAHKGRPMSNGCLSMSLGMGGPMWTNSHSQWLLMGRPIWAMSGLTWIYSAQPQLNSASTELGLRLLGFTRFYLWWFGIARYCFVLLDTNFYYLLTQQIIYLRGLFHFQVACLVQRAIFQCCAVTARDLLCSHSWIFDVCTHSDDILLAH